MYSRRIVSRREGSAAAVDDYARVSMLVVKLFRALVQIQRQVAPQLKIATTASTIITTSTTMSSPFRTVPAIRSTSKTMGSTAISSVSVMVSAAMELDAVMVCLTRDPSVLAGESVFTKTTATSTSASSLDSSHPSSTATVHAVAADVDTTLPTVECSHLNLILAEVEWKALRACFSKSSLSFLDSSLPFLFSHQPSILRD